MNRWLNTLRNQSPAMKATWLAAVVLAAFVLVGPAAYCLGGFTAVVAAAVAAALCLAGTLIALLAAHFLRGPNLAVPALLVSMTSRMGIPLAFGLAFHLRGGPLAEIGLLYYLLVFYPVALAVETGLSLPPEKGCGTVPPPMHSVEHPLPNSTPE